MSAVTLQTFRQVGAFAESYMDFGETPYDAYFLYMRHRDSDCLTNSNFEVMEKLLKGAFTFVTGCWAYGWREYLALPERADSETKGLAEDLLTQLRAYPVLSEDDWCQREDEAVTGLWKGFSVKERLYWCQQGGDSIFAARHPYPPEGARDILCQGI